jgi:hypothetical protein
VDRAGNAEYNIAIIDLAIVECHLGPLIDRAADQFGCTGNAAAIFAAIWQIDSLRHQGFEQ